MKNSTYSPGVLQYTNRKVKIPFYLLVFKSKSVLCVAKLRDSSENLVKILHESLSYFM